MMLEENPLFHVAAVQIAERVSSGLQSPAYWELYCFYCAACNADAVLWWEFCLSVCLSVCPSVRHTRGLWQNGRKISPDFYTIRKNI